MDYPLSGCWDKLNRAKLHVEAVSADIGTTLEGYGPDVLILDKKFDPEGSYIRFWVKEVRVPERKFREWGIIVGDALHNFRGALDHLAWLLVDMGTRAGTLSETEESKVQFPIYDDGPKFEAAAKSTLLPGVDPAHLAVIRRYQPYQRGDAASAHPLAVLHRMNNGDKHRVIQTLLFQPLITTYSVLTETLRYCTYVSTTVVLRPRLEQGAELVRVNVIPTGDGEPDVKMKFKGRAEVGFDDQSAIRFTLDQISSMVLLILAEFEPVFESVEITSG